MSFIWRSFGYCRRILISTRSRIIVEAEPLQDSISASVIDSMNIECTVDPICARIQ
jgi:hypothetical protein